MENQGNNDKNPAEPQVTPGVVPPRRPSGSGKWIAVIVVLLVVIGALVVLTQYHPSGSSAKVVSAASVATLNQPYNLTLQSNGVYKSLTVNWGDSHVQTFEYQGSNKVTLHHVYNSPGSYFISYSYNYGGSTFTNYQTLIPVHITASISAVSPYESYGLLELQNHTSNPIVNNTMIFNPGTNLSFIAGFFNQPLDGAHMVIGQTLLVYHNGTLVNETVLPYYFSQSAGEYQLAASDAIQNISLGTGYYTLGMQTTTGVPMTTTDVSTTVTNTTMLNYSKGTAVTYGNATTLHYGTSMNYTTVPPVISYMMNNTRTSSTVQTVGATNVTYTSANVTYDNQTNLTLPFAKDITVGAGTNFTLESGNATVAFINNGSASSYNASKTTTLNFNNTTASYVLFNNTSYKFAQATTFQVLTADPNAFFNVSGSSNYFIYGPKATVTMWNTNNQTYNANSTLTYTNPATKVVYETATNATITLEIPGVSAPLNVGEIDPSQGMYTTTYYYDVVAVKNADQYVAPVSGASFTSAEVVAGGYTTLDPQIAFFTVDSEILINTMMPLVNYNGSSASSFVPAVASAVPSLTNGGITNNSSNYTFHVRSNLKWQDGSPVTVYDAYYGLVRLMLFANAAPGTGSYLLGNYLLPFTSSGAFNTSYAAITHAITYSNSTNNITLHFKQPVPSSVVFQLIAASEADPIDANWLMAHGDGIQFTPSGFVNYSATGNLANYNTYVQNHIMADGPYEVSYNLPGSQIVLTANPNFVSPGTFDPPASIKTVSIQYFSTPSTAFLELKSGAAQSATGLPATPYWPQLESMAGVVNPGISTPSQHPSLQIHGFPTLGIYFFNFNLNTNTKMLNTLVHNENLPSTLFVNPNVRKAFAYAFNYSNYLNVNIGNALYNTTFSTGYAGMLPPGMLYNQSISQLTAEGLHFANDQNNGLTNASIQNVTKYWGYFVHGNDPNASDNFSAMGLTWKGAPGTSDVQYKGSNLVIPIFVPIGDQPDTAAATTWGNVLSQVIHGASFPVVAVTYTQIFQTYAIAGGNPMPISWGGWSPDFVYPTDYEASMSMPLNSSTYMGPASYNPWFLGGGNSSSATLYNPTYNYTEQNFTNQMISAYNNATSAQNATNASAQKLWFQQVNKYIVNQTMQVYLYQTYLYWTISSKISGHDIVQYQENQLVGAGQELTYNLLNYKSNAAYNSGV